jgi:hypothetical protein
MPHSRTLPAFLPATGLSFALRRFGLASRAAQTLGIEWLDSTKQGLDDLAATMQRLATVRSPNELLAVQTAYLHRAGDRFTARSAVAGGLITTLAGDLMRPPATPGAGRTI